VLLALEPALANLQTNRQAAALEKINNLLFLTSQAARHGLAVLMASDFRAQ